MKQYDVRQAIVRYVTIFSPQCAVTSEEMCYQTNKKKHISYDNLIHQRTVAHKHVSDET